MALIKKSSLWLGTFLVDKNLIRKFDCSRALHVNLKPLKRMLFGRIYSENISYPVPPSLVKILVKAWLYLSLFSVAPLYAIVQTRIILAKPNLASELEISR